MKNFNLTEIPKAEMRGQDTLIANDVRAMRLGNRSTEALASMRTTLTVKNFEDIFEKLIEEIIERA